MAATFPALYIQPLKNVLEVLWQELDSTQGSARLSTHHYGRELEVAAAARFRAEGFSYRKSADQGIRVQTC